MQRSKEISIDGRRYFSTQYSATKGLILLSDLAAVVGKPFGVIASTMTSGDEISKEQKEELVAQAMGEIISSVAGQMSGQQIVALVKDIISTTEYMQDDGKRRPIQFDIDFAGSYGHLFKLVKEVLSFQYSDFFGESPVEEQAAAAERPRLKVRG